MNEIFIPAGFVAFGHRGMFVSWSLGNLAAGRSRTIPSAKRGPAQRGLGERSNVATMGDEFFAKPPSHYFGF
jgi:hypothetical protein